MWSQSSKSNSNSFKSDSESSSNSGKKDGRLETMECKPSNYNTTIKRTWIIKKSISISDEHIMIKNIFIYAYNTIAIPNFMKLEENPFSNGDPKKAIFYSRQDWNSDFKHWAIILELSNDSYVNIQFGRNGFSLKEFNQTEIKGENILDAILYTWGEKNEPVSFCYLGNVNFDYEKLILREK